MYYFQIVFKKVTLDGLIDTGAPTRAISKKDLYKSKLLTNEAIKDHGPAPNFQTMVANFNLKASLAPSYYNLR